MSGKVSPFFFVALIAFQLTSFLTLTQAYANCQNKQSFSTWLSNYRKEVSTLGITQKTILSTLDGLTLDKRVLRRDKHQVFFAQGFSDISRKLATRHRLRTAKKKLKKSRSIFSRAQKKFGVPGAVIAAFWALESDFGIGMGKLPVLRSLATLAYDCRRSDMFRKELTAALLIIDQGDLSPHEMVGSWAGELGQTQFLPTRYLKHAIDYNGNGRRNLFKEDADIIGSTASYIKHLGWRRSQPWLEEVILQRPLDWSQADLHIKHPRSLWVNWGVRSRGKGFLPEDKVQASLLLPMGRKGPAFLAYHNFHIYLEWNKSLNYAITAAHLATRILGAPSIRRPKNIPVLSLSQNKRLQRLLSKRNLDVGKIDGIIGEKTRRAIKETQLKFNLPADSYPTLDLLKRLERK